jgi:hypothetical protein
MKSHGLACRGGLLLALAAVLGGACGGDDDDDGEDGAVVDAGASADAAAADAAVGPSLDEVGAAVAPALCARLLACCATEELGEIIDLDGPVTDQASCLAALEPALDEVTADLGASIEAGRLRYQPGEVDGCVQAVTDVPCEGLIESFDAQFVCEGVFIGLVADGGTCEGDADCTSAYCASGEEDEPRTCAAVPGQGDACDYECTDGLYCDVIAGSCTPQKQDDEACGSGDECLGGACQSGICATVVLCDGQD